MPVRRRLLCAGAALGAGLAGCISSGSGNDGGTVDELVLALSNGTDERQTFRFAVETTDGLGEWDSRDVPANDAGKGAVDLFEAGDVVAVHVIVDNRPSRIDLRDEAGCVHLIVEYGRLDDEPIIFGRGC